jgi:bifunctional UDP-N-acetylglucosamine pyrophosphorylase / glucosamine-1-phosphate N-acetyltransferase
MTNIKVLIAAAGLGSRSGLSYPKTLFPVKGKPILIRLLELLKHIDTQPTVIVSPSGYDSVMNCLERSKFSAYLVIQPEPLGMGDAVLRFRNSPAFKNSEHILLVWGDIPFIQQQTVAALIEAHEKNNNDFSLVTREVDAAYTLVKRDTKGEVKGVDETRETTITTPHSGERDMGLFLFRKEQVLDLLAQNLVGKCGQTTGEHGFLYIIQHLVSQGFKVQGLPIATELDIVSLNTLNDLKSLI